MRNVGTPKNASFAKASSAAVDVEYRVRGTLKNIGDISKYLNAIDDKVFPEGHLALARQLTVELAVVLGQLDALRPKKRSEMTHDEKAALKAEKAKAKEAPAQEDVLEPKATNEQVEEPAAEAVPVDEEPKVEAAEEEPKAEAASSEEPAAPEQSTAEETPAKIEAAPEVVEAPKAKKRSRKSKAVVQEIIHDAEATEAAAV